MSKSSKFVATVKHPTKVGTEKSVTVGDVYRPEYWEFYKSVSKLDELYPESPAGTMMLILRQGSTKLDSDPDIAIVEKDRMAAHIWQLYVWYDENRSSDKLTTLCLWIIRCYHYAYLHGPLPDLRKRPHKHTVNTELWREALACPSCNKAFTMEGLLLKPREVVMTEYHKWLGNHVKKECPNLGWDKKSIKSQIDAVRKIKAEERRRNDEEYRKMVEYRNAHADEDMRETLVQKENKAHNALVRNALTRVIALWNNGSKVDAMLVTEELWHDITLYKWEGYKIDPSYVTTVFDLLVQHNLRDKTPYFADGVFLKKG